MFWSSKVATIVSSWAPVAGKATATVSPIDQPLSSAVWSCTAMVPALGEVVERTVRDAEVGERAEASAGSTASTNVPAAVDLGDDVPDLGHGLDLGQVADLAGDRRG